jgi:ribosomal protein S20
MHLHLATARRLRELDIAVSKGVIHSNQAANKKSAMAKAAHKAGQKAGAR